MYFTDPVDNPFSRGPTARDENGNPETVDQSRLPGTGTVLPSGGVQLERGGRAQHPDPRRHRHLYGPDSLRLVRQRDLDFARYTATMNLLVNGDDMAGPGQNYYLWYDLGTKKISVISWDLNLAMTGNAAASPDEQLSIGGGGNGAGGGGGGAMRPPGQNDDAGAPLAGSGRGGNELKERFLASAAFQTAYDDAYAELYQQLYASGTAAGLLDAIAAVVPSSDGLTADELAAETETLRTFLQERADALRAAVGS